MCGRFYFPAMDGSIEEYLRRVYGIDILLPDDLVGLPHGREFLPWSDIPVVYNDGARIKLTSMFWNLVPSYAETFDPPHTWFNTRRDKLEAPYQRKLLRYHRCVVPASKFLENKEVSGKPIYRSQKVDGKHLRKKESYEFFHQDLDVMLLGAIYDVWHRGDTHKLSCSIITVTANGLVAGIHPRMPFILTTDLAKLWLDKNIDDADFVHDLVKSFPAEALGMRQVWPGTDVGPQQDLFGS